MLSYREWKHRRRIARLKETRGTVELDLDARRATLINGKTRFYLESDRDLPAYQTYDFAAIALTLMACEHGQPLRFDYPVSAGMVRTISQLLTIARAKVPWRFPEIDIDFTNVIATPPPAPDGGIMCQSGGVDSLHIAVKWARARGYTHALNVQGIDFKLDETESFLGRRTRVAAICDHVGLDLITMRTNLLHRAFPYAYFGASFLTMCMRFAGEGLAKGGIATDYTDTVGIISLPCTHVAGIDELLSSSHFPIEEFDHKTCRAEKLAHIHEHAPALMKMVSICHEDRVAGGNCGTCFKCMRTRLALECAGLDQRLVFDDQRDPVEFLSDAEFPRREEVEFAISHLFEAAGMLPDPDRRRRAHEICEKIRAEHYGVRIGGNAEPGG